jgi:hypothetical protein
MATTTASKATGVFDQAVGTFGEALKAGVKAQEEIAKWWTSALDQRGSVQDWQQRSREIIQEIIPAAQKSAEEWLKLVEKNSTKSIALLKRAVETDADAEEIQAKTQELWKASLDLVRENTEAIAQNNVKLMEVWSKLLKKNVESNGAASKK